MKSKYITLMEKFSDVFAWDYFDLKVYDKNIIQHIIPVEPDQNPFHQKLSKINPKFVSIH